jgi:aldehyde dehydrogenase (NAD+)
MHIVEKIYIDGQFVEPHGQEWFDLYNPSIGEVIGRVRLADAEDATMAIAAARRALPILAQSSKTQRMAWLQQLHAAMSERVDELAAATTLEYGAPSTRAIWGARFAAEAFLNAARTLEDYSFTKPVGAAEVRMESVGVAALITPWNANAGFICNKLATAIAAGCPTVIKPSEMSAIQTQIVTEALHEAKLPAGAFNIITGRGEVVGNELTGSPHIAKISFTGSTNVGKAILRASADTMKRVTLELGGKSPTIILDDAILEEAVKLAVTAGFQNSGQACIAGTRILVPEHALEDVIRIAQRAVADVKVGHLDSQDSAIGPMVSARQYERVQHYIKRGIEEGATLIAGGEGHPDGLGGYYVKPTVFANVSNAMTIAREEIFGPVLCILTYRDEDEAVAIANDTVYGLQAYVISSDQHRAHAVATRLEAGRVIINGAPHDPFAPFGGFKQSGIGREYGVFGLETFLEAKSILTPPSGTRK